MKHRIHQLLRIRILRMIQNIFRFSIIPDSSVLKYQYPVGHRPHHTNIMRYQNHRCLIFFSHHQKLLYYLFLHRHIQCTGRFICKKKIRVHDIRHSHASLLVEMGFSPLLIAERLGHEKVQTTMDTYSHLYPNKQVEVARQLDGIMP